MVCIVLLVYVDSCILSILANSQPVSKYYLFSIFWQLYWAIIHIPYLRRLPKPRIQSPFFLLYLGCTLESAGQLKKFLKPRPCFIPIKTECPEMRPRHPSFVIPQMSQLCNQGRELLLYIPLGSKRTYITTLYHFILLIFPIST